MPARTNQIRVNAHLNELHGTHPGESLIFHTLRTTSSKAL
jgi:hypothetical protein